MIFTFFVVIISLIPNLWWLWFFYKKDKYEPEPVRLIVLAFFLGAISTIFASLGNGYFSNKIFQELPVLDYGLTVYWFVFYIFGVGPCEELVKFMMVKFFIFDNEEFDEIMDGIIYSVSVALGFAFAENITYFLDHYYQAEVSLPGGGLWAGIKVIILRSFTANIGHALFGGVMGFYIGLAKFSPAKRSYYLAKALIIAALFHGIYDFTITYLSKYFNFFIPITFAILLVIAYLKFLNKKIALSLRFSPHRIRKTKTIFSKTISSSQISTPLTSSAATLTQTLPLQSSSIKMGKLENNPLTSSSSSIINKEEDKTPENQESVLPKEEEKEISITSTPAEKTEEVDSLTKEKIILENKEGKAIPEEASVAEEDKEIIEFPEDGPINLDEIFTPRICSKCGYKNYGKRKFCQICGHYLEK